MKCINCGCELPEGARFCGNCGAPQPEHQQEEQQSGQQVQQRFCPHCGGANDADAVFCSICGKDMNGDGQPVVEETMSKKVLKKLIVGAVGVVAAVVVIGGVVKIVGGLGGSKSDSYITYVKDGYINQSDIEHYKKKPVEYQGRYGSTSDDGENYSAGVSYSKDGKYICYPTDVNYGDDGIEFRLNMQKVGKTEEPVKIDSSVTSYTILDNNKILYKKAGNDTLYINDKKGNKEKIASDVNYFYLDSDQKNIVWSESNGDGTINVCQQDVALKKEKKTLAKDVDSFYANSDLKYVVVQEQDTLYMVENFGEKQKIASGVEDVSYDGLDNGGIYYTKSSEETLSAEDVVEDDCADSDATIEEPDREDYKVEKIEKNDWTGKYEKVESVDEDAYDAAYEKYYDKENRDEIRDALEDYEISTPVEKLYYVKDGKETQVDATVAQMYYYTGDWKGIVYSRYNMDDVPKLKISEIDSASSIESDYYQMLSESAQTCVYTEKDKTVVLDENLATVWGVDADSKTGYGVKMQDSGSEDEDATYNLYSFSVDNNSDGKCKLISEDVAYYQELIKDGDVYYLKDTDSDGNGDLYCNDKNIDSDVKSGTLYTVPDSDNVLYAVDYNSSNNSATLKMYDGKKDKIIADDVYSYLPIDEKHIALLIDYSMKSYRGDLQYYLGKEELKSIDEDVSFIFGGKEIY